MDGVGDVPELQPATARARVEVATATASRLLRADIVILLGTRPGP
jgi:hypothetical protein